MNDESSSAHEAEFDAGFHAMMSSALEYEWLRRQGRDIPESLRKKLDESSAWLQGLSPSDWNRLIH